MKNSDTIILSGICVAINGLGIYEGMELHPVFYIQSAVIMGVLGFLSYRASVLEKNKQQEPS